MQRPPSWPLNLTFSPLAGRRDRVATLPPQRLDRLLGGGEAGEIGAVGGREVGARTGFAGEEQPAVDRRDERRAIVGAAERQPRRRARFVEKHRREQVFVGGDQRARQGDDRRVGFDDSALRLDANPPSAMVDVRDRPIEDDFEVGAVSGDRRAVAFDDAPVDAVLNVTAKVARRNARRRLWSQSSPAPISELMRPPSASKSMIRKSLTPRSSRPRGADEI